MDIKASLLEFIASAKSRAVKFLFGSRRKSIKTLQISLLAFVATWVLWGIGGLEPLRNGSVTVVSGLRDVRVFGGAETKPSPNIVVCAIDEDSIRRLGVWPWQRSVYARLVREISRDGAAAIGLNVVLSERAAEGPGFDLELAAEIEKSQRVVLPSIVALPGSMDGSRAVNQPDIYPQAEFQQGAKGVGFVNIAVDGEPDKVCLVGSDVFKKTVVSFPLAVYEVYAGRKLDFTPEGVVVGEAQIPLEKQSLLWVDFPRSRAGRPGYLGAVVPAMNVVTQNFVPGTFSGKIVLIGRTDRAAGDFFDTPTGHLAAVEVFGYVLNTIERRSFFHSVGIIANALILLGFILLTAGVTLWFRVLWSLVVVAEELVGVAILAAVLFGRQHAMMDFPLVFTGIVMSFTFTEIYNVFLRERELTTLGIYMSPEVRQKILDLPQQMAVNGERKVLSVLFADIRGFTRFSHKLDPAATVTLLNSYFTAMVEVITRPGHDGTIDKLVGDGIIAVFGDPFPFPDQAKRAVTAAMAMQKRFTEIKRSWAPYIKRMVPKYDMNKLQLGIGVATGEVVVGNVGAPSHNFMSYTVIGDPANRAAGLQDIAAGGQILLDGDTMKQVGDSIEAKDIGEHTIKGLRMHIFQIGPR